MLSILGGGTSNPLDIEILLCDFCLCTAVEAEIHCLFVEVC